MLNILKRLLFFVIPFFLFLEGYAQQVTKEQLLKLFYKAQTALNSGQIDTAINAYVEVLKLSPGLPDTYLQLGNIYSSMTTDAAALEKACICYANYLKLKPETVDAELLKTKISEMTLGVRQLRGDSAQIPNNLEGFVDKTPVLFAGGILAGLGYGLTKAVQAVKAASAAKKTFKYGDKVGELGTYVKNPKIKVDWSQTTQHATQRMAERNMSKSAVNSIVKNVGSVPESRRGRLKKLISLKPIVRTIEAHNGLSALVVENAKVVKDEKINSFDAIWVSSLTDSTAKGKPDIELVDMTSRINTINEIMEVSSKPIILDGDTGGLIEHFIFNIK